jgi:hypothetical protein
MEKRNRGSTVRSKQAAGPAWVLLAYRMPREPSTPRISVWRKLRQLGAAQIVDGLVALPAQNRTREQFSWLAQEIREASGDAWIWEGRLSSRAQERSLIDAMSAEVSGEYRDLADRARVLLTESAGSRASGRLRRELHRIEAKDYFGVPARRAASDALEALMRALEGAH